jgi:hypothetical protein
MPRPFLVFLTTNRGPEWRRDRMSATPALCTDQERKTVKKHVLAIALALTLGGTAQADAIDLTPVVQASAEPASVQKQLAHSSAPARYEIALFQANMSELPEPEVFAMMLLGLVLIGYRASRDSDEKFK